MKKKALSRIFDKADEVRNIQELSKEETRQVNGGLSQAGVNLEGGYFNFEDSIVKDDFLIHKFDSGDWTGNVYRYSF
ncbi:TPA: hypothetical protein RQK93_000432 [Vibrio vulnificus]|nr:hypothetical protein [Vibrio vulnificus]